MIGRLQIRRSCTVFIHVTIPSTSRLLLPVQSSPFVRLRTLVFSLTRRLLPCLRDCTSTAVSNRCRTSTSTYKSPFSRSIPFVLVPCRSYERRRCRFVLLCFVLDDLRRGWVRRRVPHNSKIAPWCGPPSPPIQVQDTPANLPAFRWKSKAQQVRWISEDHK